MEPLSTSVLKFRKGSHGSPTWIVIQTYAAMGIVGTVRPRNHAYAEALEETHRASKTARNLRGCLSRIGDLPVAKTVRKYAPIFQRYPAAIQEQAVRDAANALGLAAKARLGAISLLCP